MCGGLSVTEEGEREGGVGFTSTKRRGGGGETVETGY